MDAQRGDRWRRRCDGHDPSSRGAELALLLGTIYPEFHAVVASRRHPLTGRTVRLGGTPSGTARARADSWRQMLAFVDEHLRDSANSGRH
jgi:dienelactone hydrolase